MNSRLSTNGNGMSIDIDFDELINLYGPQIIEAIAKRKRALEEIVPLAEEKDFQISVIEAARKSASMDIMRQNLQQKYKISADAASVICSTSMSDLFDFKSKLEELDKAIRTLDTSRA